MKIGIVGLGYVGLPLAISFAEAGHSVIGVDVSSARLDMLRRGLSYIEDIPDERLRTVQGHLDTTSRIARLALTDAIVVCVPTPLTPNREPDLTPLMTAAGEIARILQPGQLVVLESTTYPGTTRERFAVLLEESGLVAGVDFHVAFSPERVDPGRRDHTLRDTPKLIGGLTPQCTAAAVELYASVCDQLVQVSSPEVAEMAKILENVFRSVNIALVNELSILADRMGIDIWEVIDAAASKPFGFMRFDPGPGMGGHCLPVDPFYLSWKAREHDFVTEFIELAGKINQQMPLYCVYKIEHALNEMRLPVGGSRILILGVAYKPGVGDTRESPALKILTRLAQLGATLLYHDPHVAKLPRHELESTPLEDALREADLAVIVTAHPGIDHQAVAMAVPTVDLRGVIRKPQAVPAAGGPA